MVDGHVPRHREKLDDKTELDIKWNAVDGIISVAFLAAALTGVYFGSAAIFTALSNRELLSANISNISFISPVRDPGALDAGYSVVFCTLQEEGRTQGPGSQVLQHRKDPVVFIYIPYRYFYHKLYLCLCDELSPGYRGTRQAR